MLLIPIIGEVTSIIWLRWTRQISIASFFLGLYILYILEKF